MRIQILMKIAAYLWIWPKNIAQIGRFAYPYSTPPPPSYDTTTGKGTFTVMNRSVYQKINDCII